MTKWTKNSESAFNFTLTLRIKHAFKVSHLRKNRKNLISKIVRFDQKSQKSLKLFGFINFNLK
jgi:hypothetical protein